MNVCRLKKKKSCLSCVYFFSLQNEKKNINQYVIWSRVVKHLHTTVHDLGVCVSMGIFAYEVNTYFLCSYGKRCEAPPHAICRSVGSDSECGLDSDSESELERAVEGGEVDQCPCFILVGSRTGNLVSLFTLSSHLNLWRAQTKLNCKQKCHIFSPKSGFPKTGYFHPTFKECNSNLVICK